MSLDPEVSLPQRFPRRGPRTAFRRRDRAAVAGSSGGPRRVSRRGPGPALLGIAAVAALLYARNIAEAGLAPFYSVAVKSMSVSWKAFFYGAFDPERDDHHRQARRVVPAAGPVRAHLRLPSLVPGPAAGDRGRRLGAGHVPRGAPLGRAGRRAAGGRDLRRHAHRGVHVRAQHGGRRADHVPGAGGRQLAAGGDGGAAALAVLGGGLGRPGLPGQDAAGLDDPAGAGDRLPAGRAGRADAGGWGTSAWPAW